MAISRVETFARASKLTGLFSGLFLLTCGLAGYIAYSSTTSILEEKAKERLEIQAFHTMDKIDRMLFERHADMMLMVTDQVITSRSSTPEQINNRLTMYLDSYKAYTSLAFFDLKRIRIADTSGLNIGVQHPFNEDWPDIAKGKDFIILRSESRSAKKVVIYLAALVKDKKGLPFGVVVSKMPLENIYEIAKQSSGIFTPQKDLKMELLDKEGLILYSSYNKEGTLIEQSDDWKFLKGLISTGKKIGSARHVYDNEDEITAFVREEGYLDFKGNNWILTICTPANVAFAGTIEERNKFIIVFSVVGFFGLLNTIIFSRAVTKPLKDLSRAAAEIGKGNLDSAVKATSNDEVGQLAQAFNQMALDLKKSKRKIQDIASSVGEGIYVLSDNGGVTFMNPEAERLLGWTEAELLNRNIHDDIHNRKPDGTPLSFEDCPIHNVIKTGSRFYSHNEIFIRKDGTTFPVSILSTPLMEDGEVVSTVTAFRDITESKEAEAKIKRAREEWEHTFDSITAPIMILDTHHKIIKANKAMADKLGVTPPMAVGLTCYKAVHDKNEPTAFCPHSALLADGQSHSTEVYEERLGGHYIITVSPLFTPEGTLYGSVHYAADITERKGNEEKIRKLNEELEQKVEERTAELTTVLQSLQESEARLKIILDSVQTGILIIEADTHKIVDANPIAIKMIAAPREQIIGAVCHKFICPAEKEHCPVTDLGITVDSSERVLLTAGGEERAIIKTVVPVFFKGRKYLLESFVDISERKKVEEQLRNAQEELARKEKLSILGQLSGSVGHELRNPLGVISNAIYYLKAVMPDADETVREYLDLIKSEVNNSERIISDLLDFARTKTPQTRESTVIELVTRSLAKSSIPENIVLAVDVPETLPALKVDPLQMEQVFQNLIMNAIQAMPEGGELSIVGAGLAPALCQGGQPQGVPLQKDNFIEISVSDTGEGISPENMKKLFQPLFTTKAKGIGLGLVVCRNLVEANGGKIEVESGSGKGTTFTVSLPTTE